MNNNISFFLELFAVWYIHFSNYISPQNILNILTMLRCYATKLYHTDNDILNEVTIEKDIIVEKPKIQPKYEDKYLVEFKKLDTTFKFNEKEMETLFLKRIEFMQKNNDIIIDDIKQLNIKLNEINAQILKCKAEPASEFGISKEIQLEGLITDFNLLNEELNTLRAQLTQEGNNVNLIQSEKQALQFMINLRIEKLRDCYIIEHTPLGNVLMMYDIERETFKYYSDNAIPYRYLETVGRKYAKQFCCRPIFVDMEAELNLAKEKHEKDQKEKKEKDEEAKTKKEEAIKNHLPFENNKNVFAKFKSYNKDAKTGHVNTAAPPKNSIQNKQSTEKKTNNDVILKENANRYTYDGKFANFNFLKKIDRKKVDKKFAMTFADFKKMKQNNDTVIQECIP